MYPALHVGRTVLVTPRVVMPSVYADVTVARHHRRRRARARRVLRRRRAVDRGKAVRRYRDQSI